MPRRTCYNCPNTREIERLRDMCLNCPAMADCDHYPSRTVSMDAMKRGDGDRCLAKRSVEFSYAPHSESHTHLPPDVETLLYEKLAAFQGLSFINKILMVWLLGGGNLAEFSKMRWLPSCVRPQGTISRQAVREHIRTLKKRIPELDLFIAKMVKLNSGSRSPETRNRQKRKRSTR